MRILVKLVANELGPEKGNSLYLLQLFPGSPARVASRIAGLPRPANCI
jgi:tRNA 2-thiouridine synthesizing protein E